MLLKIKSGNICSRFNKNPRILKLNEIIKIKNEEEKKVLDLKKLKNKEKVNLKRILLSEDSFPLIDRKQKIKINNGLISPINCRIYKSEIENYGSIYHKKINPLNSNQRIDTESYINIFQNKKNYHNNSQYFQNISNSKKLHILNNIISVNNINNFVKIMNHNKSYKSKRNYVYSKINSYPTEIMTENKIKESNSKIAKRGNSQININKLIF